MSRIEMQPWPDAVIMSAEEKQGFIRAGIQHLKNNPTQEVTGTLCGDTLIYTINNGDGTFDIYETKIVATSKGSVQG